jgi:hypothetical protein
VTRPPRLLLLLAMPVLVAGCAAHGSTSAASGPASGTSTPPGSAAEAAAPPQTATMVCGDEIRTKVAKVLGLPAEPDTHAAWAASVYTCTYALPMGPMTLTVDVFPDKARAGAQLGAEQVAAPDAQPLAGLGERAFGTPTGTAVVLKDNEILTVDTTRLPEVFGPNDQQRTDLAYEVASDVLGCWTGDGDE